MMSRFLEPKKGELKPCPFCGNTDILYEEYDTPVGERWRITCAGCLATIDPGYAQTPADVREKWNRRA